MDYSLRGQPSILIGLLRDESVAISIDATGVLNDGLGRVPKVLF